MPTPYVFYSRNTLSWHVASTLIVIAQVTWRRLRPFTMALCVSKKSLRMSIERLAHDPPAFVELVKQQIIRKHLLVFAI